MEKVYYRDSIMEIDLDKMKHNIKLIKNNLSRDKFMYSVVKGNAYGYGILEVSRISIESGCDGIGVATLDEGMVVRKHFPDIPILVIGVVRKEDVVDCAQANIRITIPNVDFAQLYSSKAARTNMVNKLVGEAKSYGFDGINLDYENIKSAYAKDYLQFVRELSVACERNGIVLSTDNYKPEAYNRCYNLKEQSKFVDYVIVMAYDEHYAGTDAGSVASLPFVKEAVEDTVQLVGKEHVIAGIPFYTRIWTTTDGNTTSRAVGMQAAVDQLNSDGQVALWNDDCGQYVASYTVGNATRQIWFEEEKSIEAKMQVIQENNVAGVAGWKLGLEKSSVWPVISKYNK